MLAEKEWKVTKSERYGPVTLEETLNRLQEDGWVPMSILPKENEESVDIVAYRALPCPY